MIRKAFIMILKPGTREEYTRRHNPIWPDLESVLKTHGVSNYSIFLDHNTEKLFAYAEVQSEEQWNQIAQTDACRRWWTHMSELMLTNPDESPAAISLEEVFHLD